MAKASGEKTPDKNRVTAEGIVEAIEQDVELSIEQAKDLAQQAVEAVETKLGVGKPRARKSPTKPKPRARVAKKASSKAIKPSKPPKGNKRSR